MPDLAQRLRAVEAERPPDLWAEIETRSHDVVPLRPLQPVTGGRARLFDEHPNVRRVIAGLVAAALFLAAFYLLKRVATPTPIPVAPPLIHVANGVWGPEGILYVSDEGGADNIWVADPAGEAHQLTTNSDDHVSYSGAVWSPDATRIAFVRYSGENDPYMLTVMNADGSSGVDVAEGTDPVWSPDNATLLFEARAPRTPQHAAIVKIDGSGMFELSAPDQGHETKPITDAAWSPDGLTLVFVVRAPGGPSTAYVSPVDGWDPQVLFRSDQAMFSPALSPDGSQLAYATWRDGREEPLFVVSLSDVGAPVEVAAGGMPIWSPDGTRISYVSEYDQHGDPLEEGLALEVVDADGSQNRWLEYLPWIGSLRGWSPDASAIAYTGSDRAGLDVSIADAKGSGARAVTRGGSGWMMPQDIHY
jgi:Tol biopolymer transport system component